MAKEKETAPVVEKAKEKETAPVVEKAKDARGVWKEEFAAVKKDLDAVESDIAKGREMLTKAEAEVTAAKKLLEELAPRRRALLSRKQDLDHQGEVLKARGL